MPQGDACRFSHVLPSSLRSSMDPPQPSPAHLLNLQRLSAGSGATFEQQQQQQPGAGGLLSFGAPGAAAFAGAAGGSGSAGGSRSGTPEIRLAGGAGSSSSGSTPSMPLLHQRSGISSASAGGSGFSVTAPVFSPRDPGLSAAAAGGYGGLPAHLAVEQFGGGGYGSRPGSAANSGGAGVSLAKSSWCEVSSSQLHARQQFVVPTELRRLPIPTCHCEAAAQASYLLPHCPS